MEEIEKSEPDYKELLYDIGAAIADAHWYNNLSPGERWIILSQYVDTLKGLDKWFRQEKTIRDNRKALIAAQAKTKLTDDELDALGLKR